MLARVPADALDAPAQQCLRRRRLAQFVEQVEDRAAGRDVDVQTRLDQCRAPRIAVRRRCVLGCLLPAIERRRLNIDLVARSAEPTSELQSLMRISYAVFCLTKKQT